MTTPPKNEQINIAYFLTETASVSDYPYGGSTVSGGFAPLFHNFVTECEGRFGFGTQIVTII